MQTDPFLKLVAKDLYNTYGKDLSKIAVVFPNKRASLFFNEYLADETDIPIWSPAFYSISDLFQELSSLKLGDPIKLVTELYKIFIQETNKDETLDDFYFWGELLISDFDDIDKNMVDTTKLFVNLRDLKEIATDYTFLTPEQEEAIQQFFQNFSVERQTELKDRFLSLWDVLGGIYTNYKTRLFHQQIAYEGMLYRAVIEDLDIDKLPYEKYVFVGFNVLNKVERTFFKKLKEADKALFYWDYDAFYMDIENHEAAEFIRQNLYEFPSSLSKELFDSLSASKKVTYIATPTENAQTRILPEWLRENLTEKESETAVVLSNETLLVPILHSIPPEVKHVNITMGFPLSQTPIYSYINLLLDLQTNGYRKKTERFTYNPVLKILKHPYTRQLSPEARNTEEYLTKNNRFYPTLPELKKDDFLSAIFSHYTGNLDLCTYLIDIIQYIATIYRQGNAYDEGLNQLYRESLFKAYTTLTRFRTLIEENELVVNTDIFRRLLNRVLSGLNIPFHGEPAIGLQVMGLLETRNLDFRNIILLSANEGKIPKAGGDSSFIPYNLRKAFGMSTIEHKNAVYAYYFYRLLQRAEHITILYNTSTDGLNRGEWSRFLLQFLIEWPHTIIREHLESGQTPQDYEEIQIQKTPEVMKRMQNRFDIRVNPEAQLSPSALNTYLDCRLKFYFHYIAGLEPLNEVNSEIDSPTFGSLFHYAAELVYHDLTSRGKLICKEDIQQLLGNEVKLKDYVDKAFKEKFFKVSSKEKPEYNGLQLINAEVIYAYLKQLLRNDIQYAPFSMEGMEERVSENVEINTSKGIIKARIGGLVDRIDKKDDCIRIVDYKTGGNPKSPTNIESLFSRAEDRPGYIFQTFLYAAIIGKKYSEKVAPSLLYIHRAASESYSPVIEMGEPRKKVIIDDFSPYQEEFRERLRQLLEEIFNPEETFVQTDIIKSCEYCNFKAICKR